MYAKALIAGDWEVVEVLKVFRGRRTARVRSAKYGARLDIPTCLFFGEEPAVVVPPGGSAPSGGACA